ncbi:MAG: putative repeat protein (TIGR04138 family) [Candidatus Latescibacterota bacterium]|jgi:uncharacterized repeat protein (TIGR04138 family)
MQDDFLLKIETLADSEGLYKREAYLFIFAALDYTVRALNRASAPESGRHVSGPELAWGTADYAREQYGPLARAVLEHWGITQTVDFGRIVFSLVEAGLMRKTEEDDLDDFRDVYTFDEVFDPKRIQSKLKPIVLEQL